MTDQEELRRLRRVLAEFFNEDQIRALCLDLNVGYASLPGNSAAAKARELVTEISNQDRVFELLQAIYEIRPNAFWGEVSSQAAQTRLRTAMLGQIEGPEIPLLHPPGYGRAAMGTDTTDSYRALLQMSLERIHQQLDNQTAALGWMRSVSLSALLLSLLSVIGILVTLIMLLGHL